MREERIVVAGPELVIARPDDPESLIDEERFDEDEFMPYWAELWPSGLALAGYVAALDLAGRRVLEARVRACAPVVRRRSRGCRCRRDGLGARRTRARRRERRGQRAADRDGARRLACTCAAGRSHFDVVLAADVLYEERNAVPLLGLLPAVTADEGTVLIADPGRRHSTAFFELASKGGGRSSVFRRDASSAAGGIALLRRATSARD